MVPAASSPQSLISDPAVVVLGVGLRSIPANKGDAILPRLCKGGPSMAKARSSFLLATLLFVLAGFIVPVQQLSAQGPVSVTIESWRNDDLPVWQDTIIPAFTKRYPNIKVVFGPTAPTEYNAALNAKFSGGTAGDLITCRPFDLSLGLFRQGFLAPVNDLPGMSNFGPVAKSAWITDDGKTVFCVPMASVIHGFIYNADKWEAATMGFQNIGPNYWKGEQGRLALIAGKAKFTDPDYVAVWRSLAKWRPYLASGFEAQKYPDSQNLFTLGKAAIYPAGSWEVALFNRQAQFKMGAFPPPLPAGASTCYISDHTDIAMGMNAKTRHPEEAKKFLGWMTTSEFASLYSNALPGFFSLSNQKVTLQDPLAQTFLNRRSTCKSTIRNSYQILSRGEPNLENELWRVSAGVISGKLTPEEAAAQVQTGLAKWFKPPTK